MRNATSNETPTRFGVQELRKKSMADKLLVDAKAAANMLSVSQRTLWTHTNRGEIPRVKVGTLVRYSIVDLQKWIDSKKEESDAAQ